MRPAVFLDRDDTLIANRELTAQTDHPGDLCDPALVRLLPGVTEGLRLLRDAGLALVIVSNQGCIARGVCTVEQVEACNARLRDLVRVEAGVEFDGIYYCPHHPRGTVPPFNTEHHWRKPAPGMFLAAAADLALDLSRSRLIGDAQRDAEAAIAAGIDRARCVLIPADAPDFLAAAARALSGPEGKELRAAPSAGPCVPAPLPARRGEVPDLSEGGEGCS
jgi:D-glycero-D-manno-heptose 1,7-bisphosphate phosphatase